MILLITVYDNIQIHRQMICKPFVVFLPDVCSEWFYALIATIRLKQIISLEDLTPVHIGMQ